MSKTCCPRVIVNFKVYSEVEGTRAFNLAKICRKVSTESGVKIGICPPMLSAAAIAQLVDIPVYSQHVDPLAPGSGTGYVTPSMLHSTEIRGSLINHSEHRQPIESISKCISMCKNLDLVTCVCAESVEKAVEIAKFSPRMIAVEPPELIGGDVSVTSANPEIVSGTVEAVKAVDPNILVYCGAGVKNGEDVKTAIDLGAYGVLLASGVVKAKDPESVLRDLIKLI